MTQLEEIKIFLGSPGNVSTERKHAQTVVDELNRTVAKGKDVFIRLISSTHAFPGYGKDAQSVINKQIGQMREYDIFIGLMWNRIGTPTHRAKSGTVEELSRAVRSFDRRKKPDIWFYFRTSHFPIATKKEAEQVAEVMEFKTRFGKRSLFREYNSPAAFRDLLREHLCLWLDARQEKGSKPSARRSGNKAGTLKSKIKTTRLPSADNTKKKVSNTPLKVTKRKIPTAKNSKSRGAQSISSPKNWIMLNDLFFKAKFSTVLADKRLSLQVETRNLVEIAQLKQLNPENCYSREIISFADSHEAGLMYVSSMTISSVSGKSLFNIMLEVNQQSRTSGIGLEMSYSGYTAEQIAELRIRLLLLGEPLPGEVGRLTFPRVARERVCETITDGEIFSNLWKKLQIKSSSQFLPKAWLWAAYNLKVSQSIEDVLELKLGPVKNKMMSVKFRGKRKKLYYNKEHIISVTGNCKINA